MTDCQAWRGGAIVGQDTRGSFEFAFRKWAGCGVIRRSGGGLRVLSGDCTAPTGGFRGANPKKHTARRWWRAPAGEQAFSEVHETHLDSAFRKRWMANEFLKLLRPLQRLTGHQLSGRFLAFRERRVLSALINQPQHESSPTGPQQQIGSQPTRTEQ